MTTSSKTEITAVYTPASQLTEPIRLRQGMLRDLALLSRELAWRLFVRNISSRHRQTILGYAWAVVTPIATTSVVVFLQKAGHFTVGETQVPYAVLLLTGLILWQVFADANGLTRPVNAMAAAKSARAYGRDRRNLRSERREFQSRPLSLRGAAASVVGVDIDGKAIAYANEKHRIDSTLFICSSGDTLAIPDGCVDAVISFETLEHLPNDVALVEENSGSDTPLNHGQRRGIVVTTTDNQQRAECYHAVC